MRVLFVNHTGAVSGAERSLLDLLDALPPRVEPIVACPDGELARAVREKSIPLSPIPATALSLRLRALETPRQIGELIRASAALRALCRNGSIDLIHANTTRAGLMVALGRNRACPPTVVHVRDCLPRTRLGLWARRIIDRGADIILANSAYTAASFAFEAGRTPIRTVYNAVDLTRFDPAKIPVADARRGLGFSLDVPLLAVVGQITPWKGQADAIRILEKIRGCGLRAELLLVGGVKFAHRATRYDNEAYEASLHELVSYLKLEGSVHFLGQRDDIPTVMRALDVLLVPSWEEPFGRSIVEAMAMTTPVVATELGGPAEIIDRGEDGLLLPPREPAPWAREIVTLISRPELRRTMGRRGREKVLRRFSSHMHTRGVLEAYDDVLAGTSGVAA